MSTIAFKTSPFTTFFRSNKSVGIYPTTDKTYSISYDDGKILAEAEYVPFLAKEVIWDKFGEKDELYLVATDARITHLYVCHINEDEMTEMREAPEWFYQRLCNIAVDDYNDNHAEPVTQEEPDYDPYEFRD